MQYRVLLSFERLVFTFSFSQIMPTMNSSQDKAKRDETEEITEPSALEELGDGSMVASIEQLSSFAERSTRFKLGIGLISALVSGCVLPGLVFFASRAVKGLSSSSVGTDDFMSAVRAQSFFLMGLGAMAFFSVTAQAACFTAASGEMANRFKNEWFRALLRQDASFFDEFTSGVAGYATLISSNAVVLENGFGNKLASGIQYTASFVISFVFAFVSSWRVTLMILATIPLVAASMVYLFRINSLRGAFSSSQYAKAGNLVYNTLGSLKTVLSIDMLEHRLGMFQDATTQVMQASTEYDTRRGLATGLAIASFLVMYLVTALFGTYLLYDQVRKSGCDPSGGVDGVPSCQPEGADIVGALLAIVLSSWGLPQITEAAEGISKARAACYPAIVLLNEVIEKGESSSQGTEQSESDSSAEEGKNMFLHRKGIDALSNEGIRLAKCKGIIEFKELGFSYPSRREKPALSSFSLAIPAGTKVAFVGPSGSGVSSKVCSLSIRSAGKSLTHFSSRSSEKYHNPIGSTLL
jgi:ATP-binding cassette subfamily B (MDR/TAP) protein 1